MKRLIICSLLTLVTFSSSGQNANISDLISMTKCHEFKCFNEHAVKSGFVFRDSIEHTGLKDNGTMFDFFLSNSPKTYPPVTALSITYISSDSVECCINTSDKAYYLALKKQMDKLGFIPSSDDTGVGAKITWYESKSYSPIKTSIAETDSVKEEYFSIVAHTW